MRPDRYIKLILTVILLSIFPTLQAQDDDIIPVDTAPKVRLGFHGHNNSYRQILIGFHDGECTDAIDPGYDAINTFNLANDMYFWCSNTELFIQGVGGFNCQNNYPLGVKSDAAGTIIIQLEGMENFNATQQVYIYDAVDGTYNSLKAGQFTANVAAGTSNQRFSLRFSTEATLGVNPVSLNQNIAVAYYSASKSVSVRNTSNSLSINSIAIYNLSGQKIQSTDVAAFDQHDMVLPLNGMATGTYIVNIQTTRGTVSKKILVQ